MNKQRHTALLFALTFALSLPIAAQAHPDRDFSDTPSSPDPVVQTTRGYHETTGESVERNGMHNHQADFRDNTDRFRNDGQVPLPDNGQTVKNDDISGK